MRGGQGTPSTKTKMNVLLSDSAFHCVSASVYTVRRVGPKLRSVQTEILSPEGCEDDRRWDRTGVP